MILIVPWSLVKGVKKGNEQQEIRLCSFKRYHDGRCPCLSRRGVDLDRFFPVQTEGSAVEGAIHRTSNSSRKHLYVVSPPQDLPFVPWESVFSLTPLSLSVACVITIRVEIVRHHHNRRHHHQLRQRAIEHLQSVTHRTA